MDDAKFKHLQHLQRVQAALMLAGLKAEAPIIDLILRLDKAVAEYSGMLSIADIEKVNQENIEYHSKP